MSEDKIVNLIERMRSVFFESTSDDPIEMSFKEEISSIVPSELLANIYITCKSNIADKLLLDLPDFLNRITYEDVLDAFRKLSGDELAVYYFSRLLAEFFGVDPHELVANTPQLHDQLEFVNRSFKKGELAPSDWSKEFMNDRGVSQEILMAKMSSHGAPMILKTR